MGSLRRILSEERLISEEEVSLGVTLTGHPEFIRRVVGLLNVIATLGSWGASRTVHLSVDGDGAERLKVRGLEDFPVEGMEEAIVRDALRIDERGHPSKVDR